MSEVKFYESNMTDAEKIAAPLVFANADEIREAAEYVILNCFYGGTGAVNGPFGSKDPFNWFCSLMSKRLVEMHHDREFEAGILG